MVKIVEEINEAKKLVDNVVGVTVKESLSEFGAMCYPLNVTKKMIFESAKKIAENTPEIMPYNVGRAKVEFTLNPGRYTDIYNSLYPLNGNVSVIEGETVLEAYAEYWNRKLICQKHMED